MGRLRPGPRFPANPLAKSQPLPELRHRAGLVVPPGQVRAPGWGIHADVPRFLTAAGLIVSFGLTRLLGRLLYGVSPLDPIVFVGVSSLLAAAGFLASLIPARRATRVDPIVALRVD